MNTTFCAFDIDSYFGNLLSLSEFVNQIFFSLLLQIHHFTKQNNKTLTYAKLEVLVWKMCFLIVFMSMV